MIRVLALAALVWVAGCKPAGVSADVSEETKTGVDTPKGSAGGFSAGLAADLATADVAAGTKPAAGSADSGAAATATGSGSAVAETGSGSGVGSGSAVAETKPTKEEPAGSGAGSAKIADTAVTTPVEAPKPPVAMTADMKAIKLSLGPNWVRDVVGAGTLSLEVNVQSRDVKFTFKFNYGYDDPKAPTDREAYKKYLADSKQLNVTVDRQQGAAWYLEGSDAAGRTAFRILVIYGGKRLICGGSSYKESDLGDIRDEVVGQAKKICETISL